MTREETISKVTAIAEEVAAPAGIEVAEVELKGSGKSHLLRIYIDRPEGVTHSDCELVSRHVSAALDAEDPIPGTYELEVSSPGVERNLGKWQDWQRFTGKKVKVILKAAANPAANKEALTNDAVEQSAPISKHSGAKQTTSRRALKQNGAPVDLRHFDGVIARAEDHTVTLELPGGSEVSFPFDQVDHANLKFEW